MFFFAQLTTDCDPNEENFVSLYDIGTNSSSNNITNDTPSVIGRLCSYTGGRTNEFESSTNEVEVELRMDSWGYLSLKMFYAEGE